MRKCVRQKLTSKAYNIQELMSISGGKTGSFLQVEVWTSSLILPKREACGKDKKSKIPNNLGEDWTEKKAK